jgi:hypothetical protein
MSPGTFWGRPGPGVNPYAAVGAPVHVQHTPYGMPADSLAGLREDPGGYFPPVPPQDYFPFVPPSSGLANEVIPDSYSEDSGNTRTDPEERTVSSSDSRTGTKEKPKKSTNNWPTSDDDEDKDVEIVTGRMGTFRLNGQYPQRRASSLFSESSGTTELERSRPSATSLTGSTLPVLQGLHRPGSDSAQALLDQPSQSTSASAPPAGPRRVDIADIASEESSSVSRKAVAIGLGIRVPGA